jgi:hypothetical protein
MAPVLLIPPKNVETFSIRIPVKTAEIVPVFATAPPALELPNTAALRTRIP